MIFAIIGRDVENSLEKRLAVRPAHLERLQCLQAAGKLILAGPFPATADETPGFTGSLILAEFDSLTAAQRWADQDPYVAAGVYAQVDVKPFKRVF